MCFQTPPTQPAPANAIEPGRMTRFFQLPTTDMNLECFALARRVRAMAWAYEKFARDAASQGQGENLEIIEFSNGVLDYVDRCMSDLEAEAERRSNAGHPG